MFVKPTKIGEVPTTWRAFPERDWVVSAPIKNVDELERAGDVIGAMYALLYNEHFVANRGKVRVDASDLHEGGVVAPDRSGEPTAAHDRGPERHTYLVARDMYLGDLATLRAAAIAEPLEQEVPAAMTPKRLPRVAAADMSRIAEDAAEHIMTMHLPEPVSAVA